MMKKTKTWYVTCCQLGGLCSDSDILAISWSQQKRYALLFVTESVMLTFLLYLAWLVMCWLGLEATGHAWLGLAQAKPGQASAWLELASGSGLGFCKPEAMAQAMACVTIQ